MYHNLNTIANSRFFDEARFVAYVKTNHADKLDQHDMVSTWHVDELVQGYRDTMTPEAQETERQRIIQEKMKARQG